MFILQWISIISCLKSISLTSETRVLFRKRKELAKTNDFVTCEHYLQMTHWSNFDESVWKLKNLSVSSLINMLIHLNKLHFVHSIKIVENFSIDEKKIAKSIAWNQTKETVQHSFFTSFRLIVMTLANDATIPNPINSKTENETYLTFTPLRAMNQMNFNWQTLWKPTEINRFIQSERRFLSNIYVSWCIFERPNGVCVRLETSKYRYFWVFTHNFIGKIHMRFVILQNCQSISS